MKSDPTITFFPVGNGDTTLITFPDATSDKILNVMIDCNIRSAAEDADGNEIFDVHAFLLDTLPRDPDGRPHLDAFVVTHPDQDHCRGYERVFYTGDPKKYGKADAEAGKVLVDEVWFAPRVFAAWEELCDDATRFKDDAERRMDLHRAQSPARNDAGNRLRLIGYSDNPDLEGLEAVLTVPGETVNVIDNKEQPDFRFFVLAPVKGDSDDELVCRNDTSIVLHARFDVDGVADACTVLLGGDSGCPIWERIVELNDMDELAWDILLAPHHCSWHFFSELSHKESQTPGEPSLEVLTSHREGAWVVASSKAVEDDDDDPPSYLAAELYLDAVGTGRFICTADTPSRERPLPLVFVMTANGPAQGDQPDNKSRARGAVRQTVSAPRTYGQ